MDQVNETGIARRSFLAAAAAAIPATYFGREVIASDATAASATRASAEAVPGLVMRERQPMNLESPFEALEGFITPNEKFYVRNHFKEPGLTADTWKLKVEGLVERPFEITFAELEKMAQASAPVTLECAGNGRVLLIPKVDGAQWERGAVNNAEWSGVPLAAILERAGVKAGAVEIVLEGADKGETTKPSRPAGDFHYSHSIPLAVAKQGGVLLAHKMNGKPLPPGHGFPVRAVVPGWYGMASVKWLTRIVVVDKPYTGYFQTVDYAYWVEKDGLPTRVPLTEMQVKSQIARPASGESVAAGKPYRVFGAAWGTGGSAVTKVEVSGDGGKTYIEAKLLGKPSPGAWQLWECDWQVPAARGKAAVMVRATDERGVTQPMERDKNRESYMINHVVPVDVMLV